MSCPCGCGGTVKPGNTWARSGCYIRMRQTRTLQPFRERDQKLATGVEYTPVVHEPQTSWWAETPVQRDRAAFKEAVTARLPHIGMTKFGLLLGTGITAECVDLDRPQHGAKRYRDEVSA